MAVVDTVVVAAAAEVIVMGAAAVVAAETLPAALIGGPHNYFHYSDAPILSKNALFLFLFPFTLSWERQNIFFAQLSLNCSL